MRQLVRLRNGPMPYREALERRLLERGYAVSHDEADQVDCTVIVARSQADWDEASDLVLWTPTVVVIEVLEIELYTRALSLGAGVVQIDTSTSIMVDAIGAAISGETILPLSIAPALAAHKPPETHDLVNTPLTPVEEQVASALVADKTVAEIASELHYSERTIRRHLQGIYLKLGATNRKDAIRMYAKRFETS